MAAIARMDQEKRTIEVDRLKLITTLVTNRDRHVKDYQEAMAGYKTLLLGKIDAAFDEAKTQLSRKYDDIKAKVAAFTDSDIVKQRDSITLVDDITVEMKVPRSYAQEYDAAIDMAHWDVRETLELTHAEFTCFVRDQWDWKVGFDTISTMYKARV